MSDLISNKNTTQQIEIDMEDYRSKKIAISDILFIKDIDSLEDTEKIPVKIHPAMNNNFPAHKGPLYIYFNLYTEKSENKVTINYELKNKKGKTEIDTTIKKTIDNSFTNHLLKIGKNKLKSNKYTCIITVKDNKGKVKKKNDFSFFWINIPVTSNDLTLALQQMVYIVSSDSLDKYRDTDPEEQKRFFISFWKSRDPNPMTEIKVVSRW